jgi:hypothetical protein
LCKKLVILRSLKPFLVNHSLNYTFMSQNLLNSKKIRPKNRFFLLQLIIFTFMKLHTLINSFLKTHISGLWHLTSNKNLFLSCVFSVILELNVVFEVLKRRIFEFKIAVITSEIDRYLYNSREFWLATFGHELSKSNLNILIVLLH